MIARVVVADDGAMMRSGLAALLGTDPSIELVGEVGTLAALMPTVQTVSPHVLLLDLRWSIDDRAAITLIPMLKQAHPSLRIVAVSAHHGLLYEAIRHGADDALVNTFTREQLLKTVHGERDDDERVMLADHESLPIDELMARLAAIPVGVDGARAYERLTTDLLRAFWGPYLSEFHPQCRVVEAGEIWDCVALNESQDPFWTAMRQSHGAIQVIFEFKNVAHVKPEHVRQLGDYLADAVSHFGVIVTRNDVPRSARARASRMFREQRKVVLFLTDRDIIDTARLVVQRGDPMQALRHAYLTLTRTSA